MKLYDALIEQTETLLSKDSVRLFPHRELSPGRAGEILLKKDTALELGGSQLPCVSTLAVTMSRSFPNDSYLSGRDLKQLSGDTAFGKAVFLEIGHISDEQELFQKIKELEAVRYRYTPEGFMTRASAFNMREQIRVSKKTRQSGVSFSDYAEAVGQQYLAFDYVKSFRIYLTTEAQTVRALKNPAEKIRGVTSALNHILDNMAQDCASCSLKELCDEVEGLRELHRAL